MTALNLVRLDADFIQSTYLANTEMEIATRAIAGFRRETSALCFDSNANMIDKNLPDSAEIRPERQD
jgi:hypothetical protein